MLKGKQIAVIGLVVLLMGLLFSLDIKGLVKEEGQHAGEGAEAATQVASISLESVSEAGKQNLSSNMSQQITDLESQLKKADASNKAGVQRQLAEKWNDVNIPAPSAFYYEAIAQSSNGYPDWLKAGDLFTSAYQMSSDSLAQPALVQKAISSYQKALELQPESLEAKTGLGVAYVSGTPNPMQGIQLLLEVVKKDPENINANMNLGLFSMKSGQFAKAVDRFKTVIAKEPKPETWLYLAMAYENLGDKENAIAAYTKGKELAADPSVDRLVEQKLQELRK
ncbi:tetratricopeptide repeat protein [Desertivirga xinjiangensis]|uniref:tetratricopeptide repeat protein n=1 Tax=Desertivirga xinjiangensis TaxID=539206 RepID=UPI00210B3C69|nr:tetratricopeptide repeat protein [Pedobacter xinjiangensis]